MVLYLGFCGCCRTEHGNADYFFSFLFSVPLGIYQEVGFLGYMVVLLLILGEISILFSVVAAPVYISWYLLFEERQSYDTAVSSSILF